MKIRSQLIIKLSAIVLLIGIGYSSLNNPAWAAKMYKWVDANGKLSYQDKPPPKSGKLIETSELKKSVPDANSSTANQQLTPVTAYTIPDCSACAQLMTFLKKTGISVVELSLQDREVQSRILTLSGKLSAPTLFVGDSLVNDLSESGLISTLKKAGYALPDGLDSNASQTEDLRDPAYADADTDDSEDSSDREIGEE